MKSIGARLALWYAAAATTTFACLFLVGYYLLHSYLIHGLDLLNQSEFEQIRAHLGPDYRSLSAAVIDQRIRETTEFASVLFYIDIHDHNKTIFFSSNLQGRSIPDIKGYRKYDVDWDNLGQLRVGEFIMAPYDVIIATPEIQVAGVMDGYAEVCAALLALMLAMSIAIGLGLSHVALRPVRAIRATAQNLVAARLYGVEPRHLYAVTFGIGIGLAGTAGGLYGTVSQINPYIGAALTAKSFAISIIGGLDNPLGVIVGGLFLGVLESLTALYVGSTYADVASFGVLVLVLIVRPNGLLGKAA